MRVVLDTNVLVAALKSDKGCSFEILRLVDLGIVSPIISVPMLVEYESVLKRPGLVPMSHNQIDTFLDSLTSIGVPVIIKKSLRPLLNDRDDEIFVDVALNGGSQTIVTNNIRDFVPAGEHRIFSILPHEFLNLLVS